MRPWQCVVCPNAPSTVGVIVIGQECIPLMEDTLRVEREEYLVELPHTKDKPRSRCASFCQVNLKGNVWC